MTRSERSGLQVDRAPAGVRGGRAAARGRSWTRRTSGRRSPGSRSGSPPRIAERWPAATSSRPGSTPGTPSTAPAPATTTRPCSPSSATWPPEPSSAPTIDVDRVDPEIAEVPGPQLVVPSTTPRYALNAANARWGSLFDAFYGTDALPQDHELAKGYDERRGAQVIEAADELLDELFPLATGSHTRRHGVPAVDRGAGRGHVEPRHGRAGRPVAVRGLQRRRRGTGSVLLVRNGLHVELVHRPRPPRSGASTTPTSPTSCWSRRSPRSSTWRTRSRPWTARTRRSPTAPGSA